jgi:hypothetical protein
LIDSGDPVYTAEIYAVEMAAYEKEHPLGKENGYLSSENTESNAKPKKVNYPSAQI